MSDHEEEEEEYALARRCVTIAIFFAIFVLNLHAIARIRSLATSNSSRNSIMKKVLYGISASFLIHSVSAIFVTVRMQMEKFQMFEIAVMAVSCATNLTYMVLMLYPMWIKLTFMSSLITRTATWITCFFIASTKTISFILLIYIAAVEGGKAAAGGDELELDENSMTEASEILNMAANQVYSVFVLVAIISYSRFLEKFLSDRSKIIVPSSPSSAAGSQESNHQKLSRHWNVSIVFFSIASVVTCALSFRNTAHAVGIAVNGLASSVLHLFNIWLDQNLVFNIQSRSVQALKGGKSKTSLSSSNANVKSDAN